MNPAAWNWASVARWAGTAVMAALVSLYTYYPQQHWIPVAVAVLSTLGFHVVPSGAQSAAASMIRRAYPQRTATVTQLPQPEERQP